MSNKTKTALQQFTTGKNTLLGGGFTVAVDEPQIAGRSVINGYDDNYPPALKNGSLVDGQFSPKLTGGCMTCGKSKRKSTKRRTKSMKKRSTKRKTRKTNKTKKRSKK